MATAFDTLTTYEAITAAGIDDRGARAISKAIADSASSYRADLATKSDLAGVKAELKADIAEVKAELKGDIAGLHTEVAGLRELIASTQNRTLIWMFGMLVTFAGIILAAVKLG